MTSPALLLLLATLAVTPSGGLAEGTENGASSDPVGSEPALVSVQLRVKPLPAGVRRISMERGQEGERWFLIERVGGQQERLTPDQFAALFEPDDGDRSWLFRLLNISSPIGFLWVALGFLGQLTFTGRMLLQWLVSEREKRSVVPVGFWWMSLIGASMLLLYFIWRKDIVGVLGQCAGWTIYSRNLWMIYRERRRAHEAAAQSP
jgi:lipid-A-disaccharide synthase-like uncharacterized protein